MDSIRCVKRTYEEWGNEEVERGKLLDFVESFIVMLQLSAYDDRVVIEEKEQTLAEIHKKITVYHQPYYKLELEVPSEGKEVSFYWGAEKHKAGFLEEYRLSDLIDEFDLRGGQLGEAGVNRRFSTKGDFDSIRELILFFDRESREHREKFGFNGGL
jgi:hypothetical protein